MKIDLLTHDFPTILRAASGPPRLSLYQPTRRQLPDHQDDQLRFQKLVKELELSLQQTYSEKEIRVLLEPFDALVNDQEFWDHTLDGLAAFAAPGFFHVFGLQRAVPELAVVAETFHTKPLWRFLQSAGRYQVLALSPERIRLLEGNRYALDEIALARGVPRTISEALGEEVREHTQVADFLWERFFRIIDRAMLERHSEASELPLLLAALPEHQQLFHRISTNPFLAADGIAIDPDGATAEELRARAWKTIEPRYHARLEALGAEFREARTKDLGSDELAQVAKAATKGGIAALLVEADRQIPGRLDRTTGEITLDDLGDPQVDDLLDDLGDVVAERDGLVLVVPAQMMPTTTGLAAIYRH
ncbi:MAG TPA: hypothetical protein VIT18_04235 [Terrimicrobiaceae bacterium]